MAEDKTAQQAEMLANRLRKKFKHLAKWTKRTGTSAFRLYDRDIPEIPLVLDYYADSENGGAVSGALFQRPYEKDDADEERWLQAMQQAASDALGIAPEHILLKRRLKQKGLSQYEKNTPQNFTRVVNEGGLRFKVNLSDYIDSGLFLDRRMARALIAKEAVGKKVLNLFCYTASFSVSAASGCAANGGALSTNSVDLSNTYLSWAKENFSLNGITADIISARDFFASKDRKPHLLIRDDVLSFLETAKKTKCLWDIIILDPPAFSNSKKMETTLDLKRDHEQLIANCLSLLAPNGKLLLSVNTKNFRINTDSLVTALKPQFPTLNISDLTAQMVDEDFRGKRTPGCFWLEIF